MWCVSRCVLVVFTPAYPELERFAERCFLPRHPLRHSPVWLDENDFQFNLKNFERLQIRSPLQIDHQAHDRYRSPYRTPTPTPVIVSTTTASEGSAVPVSGKAEQEESKKDAAPIQRTSFSKHYYDHRKSAMHKSPVVTPICAMKVEYPLLLLNADQVVVADKGYGNGAAHLRMHAARLMHIKGALANYGNDHVPQAAPVEIGDLESEFAFAGGSSWDRAAICSATSPGVSEYFPKITSGMMNAVTGKPFGTDINNMLLAIKERERYSSPWWATLVQWKSIGAVPDKRNCLIHRLSYTKLTKLVHISLIRNALDVLQRSYINSHTRLFRCLTPPELMAFDEYRDLQEGGHDAQRYLSTLAKKMFFPVSIQKDMSERYAHLQNCVSALTREKEAQEEEAQAHQKAAQEKAGEASAHASRRKRKKKTDLSDDLPDASHSSTPAVPIIQTGQPSSSVPQCSPISTAVYPKDMIQVFFPLYVSSASIQRHGLVLREDACPVVIDPPLIPDAIEVLETSSAPSKNPYSSFGSRGAAPSFSSQFATSASQNAAKNELRYLYHISTISTPSGEALEPPLHIRATLLASPPLQPMHGLTGQPLSYEELDLPALQQSQSQLEIVLALQDNSRTPIGPTSPAAPSSPSEAALPSLQERAAGQTLAKRSIWFYAEDVLALGGVVDVNASPVEVHPHSPQNLRRESEAAAAGMDTKEQDGAGDRPHDNGFHPLKLSSSESSAAASDGEGGTSIFPSGAPTASETQSPGQPGIHAPGREGPPTSYGSGEAGPPVLYHVSSFLDVNGFLAAR